MIGLEWIAAFLALGIAAGFAAGLLGIGGGGLMVPILTSIFIAMGIDKSSVVHLALGTSMCSIVITSISSLRAHHAKGGVLWHVVKQITPGIVVGTFAATFLAASINATALAFFFTCFMSYVSVQMLLAIKPKPSRTLPNRFGLFAAGSGIGGLSALVSIGGGSLSVPFLTWCNTPIKKAIGTSAAIGLPLSLAGSAGYLLNGLQVDLQVEFAIGFVYWPAVILISVMTAIFAPIGAKVAHTLPVPVLKKVFALLLFSLSMKMLWSVIG